MKLKLVAAISALAIPALAHAQQGGPQPKVPKPTKADAQSMFAELSTARLLLIRSPAERCEHSASINARAQGQHFVFGSERGAPLSAPGFSRIVERAGRAAKLGIKVHAHMLRHACGYALANAGHDTRALQAYLGHANIQNTTRYTALAQDRFKGFWRD
jgi:integrase